MAKLLNLPGVGGFRKQLLPPGSKWMVRMSFDTASELRRMFVKRISTLRRTDEACNPVILIDN